MHHFCSLQWAAGRWNTTSFPLQGGVFARRPRPKRNICICPPSCAGSLVDVLEKTSACKQTPAPPPQEESSTFNLLAPSPLLNNRPIDWELSRGCYGTWGGWGGVWEGN